MDIRDRDALESIAEPVDDLTCPVPDNHDHLVGPSVDRRLEDVREEGPPRDFDESLRSSAVSSPNRLLRPAAGMTVSIRETPHANHLTPSTGLSLPVTSHDSRLTTDRPEPANDRDSHKRFYRLRRIIVT